MNGQSISSIVHSARPVITPHSSSASRGRNGAWATVAASGERKEHILELGRRERSARAQLVERARTANSAAGEQHETVAHALGISQLMNGHKERAPARGQVANELHHFADLSEIKPVEGLVQQEEWMRRDQ